MEVSADHQRGGWQAGDMSVELVECNPNMAFAETLVEGLAAAGMRAACIAPGSRSTPLALAFDAHPAVDTYVHLDERCASFFALGLAQAGGRPVGLVCTSGTAAAEFHAAVAEAYMAGVPLVVITADRPPELRHSGANQTIDQVKMYGDHALWAVDAGLAERDAPGAALRNVRTLAARSVGVADGLRKGPVHINIPFRKPLEPAAPYRPRFEREAGSSAQHGVLMPTAGQLDRMAELVAAHERGWIVCGPWTGAPPTSLVEAAAEMGQRTGYPIFADPLSGLRFGAHTESAHVAGSYESFLQHGTDFEAPEVVIRLGAMPTSKSLNEYLDWEAPPFQVHIRSSGVWADDSHRVRSFLQVDEAAFCRGLAERIHRGPGSWAESVMAAERRCAGIQRAFLEAAWFDAAAVAASVEALPAGANLVAGNSLPVRHVDQFAGPDGRRIRVFGNRGASGIDGVISTAMGIAAADRDAPTMLLIGDVSFCHDMNGLLAASRHGLDNITIVLLNNGGGGIFRRLPIAEGHAQFERLFLTQPELDFGQAAALYGFAFVRIEEGDRAGLARALGASVKGGKATIVEVRTDGARDEKLRRKLMAEIQKYGEENS